MQNSDFTFDEALKKRLNFGDSLQLESNIPSFTPSQIQEYTGFGSSLGTPEMMAAGAGLQILGQYLDAPYKEMAAKQAMEMQRRDKQDAALKNLQEISQLYGRL